jgi:hypothetical protein
LHGQVPAQVIGTLAFVDKSEYEERVTLDLVVDEVGKWPTLTAGKSMNADVVAASPTQDSSDRLLHTFGELLTELG